MTPRFFRWLRRAIKRPWLRQDFAWLAVICLALAWLVHAGWFAAVLRAGITGVVIFLVSMLILVTAVAVLWPVAAHLLRALFSGDPYWIAPREFDTEDDPGKTRALMLRLAAIEMDADARLWQDRDSGQLWISRRFDLGHGEFTRFKPLKNPAHWRGMEDDDWAVKE